MTISNTNTRSGPYYPNGVTVAFPFAFRALDKGDVQVVRIDFDGTDTTVSNALFDVVLTVNGGSVVFAVPPAAGNPLYVQLDPAFSQEISFENEGAFLPEVLTEALDRSAQRSLWLREGVLRAPLVPAGEVPIDFAPGLASAADGTVLAIIGGKIRAVVNSVTGAAASALLASQSAATAVFNAAAAVGSAAMALNERLLSTAARIGAEAARDAAVLSANIYATEALGRAGVGDGQYFRVVGDGATTAFSLYRRDSDSTSTFIASFPSTGYFTSAFPVSTGASLRSRLAIGDLDPVASKGAALVDSDGRLQVASLSARAINGTNGDALVRNRNRFSSSSPADVIVLNVDGQSLMEGGGSGGGFPTPPGRNYAFIKDKNNPGVVDIKVYDTTDVTLGLPGRVTGMIWMLRQLMLEEDGIPYDLQPIIVFGNNATGSTFLSVHQKGGAWYTRALQQAAIARTFGRNMGLRVRHLGTNWGQGESEAPTFTGTSYYGGLQTLAANYTPDLLAVNPEQTFNPKLLTYATASGIVGPGRRGVARAQHKLAIDRPDICLFSSALYHLPYTYDTGSYPDMQGNSGGVGGGAVHTSMIGSIWGGANEGLARKRHHFDGKDWLPFRPVSFEVEGNSVFITYAVRGDDIVINTTDISTLTDYGVVVRDTATGNAVAMAQLPRVVGSRVGGGMRTICLTFASAPLSSYRYEFGLGVNDVLYPYKGGATNFTVDHGLTLECLGKRMFDPMPPHAILPAVNAAGLVLTLDA